MQGDIEKEGVSHMTSSFFAFFEAYNRFYFSEEQRLSRKILFSANRGTIFKHKQIEMI